MSYDDYRLRSKNEKLDGIKTLERQRNRDALLVLFDFAKKDVDKDVRKAAIDSILVLNDPEAIPVLQTIQSDDRDRGVRNKAKSAARSIQTSGKPISPEEFSESDEERASEDFRALDESEKKQAGLNVRVQENFKYFIDRDNNLTDEEGEELSSLTASGKVEIKNTGRKDRIWAIDAVLEGVDNVTFDADEEQGTAVFGNSFALKELDPQEVKYVPFQFEAGKPQLKIEEDFWDAVAEDSETPPIFSRGEETAVRFTLKLTNEHDWPLTNVVAKKYYYQESTSVNEFQSEYGNIRQADDSEGVNILWEVGDIGANSSVQASCVMKVTLPEDNDDPYMVGNTIVKYGAKETSTSGLNLDTIKGSSSVFQFISREEQEENPGDFDCLFELENTSEFEMDLKEVRIFEGPLDEGNVRLEWLGKDFPEEERSIDPSETFSLDPWTITVEEDGVIPQFGRELDLSVKYLYDSEILAECILPGYALPFIGFTVMKSFVPMTIPSFRRTQIMTENQIQSIGSTDIQYLQLIDDVPTGFETPSKEEVSIVKGGEALPGDSFEYESIGENKIQITMEHLEDTYLGTLKENEEMLVKYPYHVTAKPEEEFAGKVTVLGNIYPEVKPISKEAEAGPITVIHERRKLKIGKMVSSTSGEDRNEYEVVLRGTNDGTALITNVEITDFLPQGFELAGDTHEDPPVGFEEHSSVNNGRAMKWIFQEVQPGQKVEIRFKIRAPGEHDPAEVFRMLTG
ncbi:MAG: HEAT repeat domain-containing protein [Candidatus Hodarchaeales archaeon]